MPLTSMFTPNLTRLASVTALTAATLLGSLAHAQTAAPSPAPATAPAVPSSPAKQALVKRILDLQRAGIENLGSNLAAAPLLQMRQQIGQLLQQRVAADRREAVAREIEGDMRKYVEDVAPLMRERAVRLAPSTMGTLLDERFTEAELKEVVALLESPVNRKYQSMAQEFQRGLGEKVMSDTRSFIEPKLRALDQTLATRLGLNNPPAAAPAAPSPSAPPAAPRN